MPVLIGHTPLARLASGGVLRFGPDGKLYVFVGDVGRRGFFQNLPCGPTVACPETGPALRETMITAREVWTFAMSISSRSTGLPFRQTTFVRPVSGSRRRISSSISRFLATSAVMYPESSFSRSPHSAC